MIKDEDRYRILKLLASNSNINQRQLAKKLSISLGKVNYCLKALAEKGLIRAIDFRGSPKKDAYAYLLTSKGIEEKARVTLRYLERKEYEFKILLKELEQLRLEVESLTHEKMIYDECDHK